MTTAEPSDHASTRQRTRWGVPRYLRAIASLLLSTAFLLASIGLLGIVLPVRGDQAGFGSVLLGALAAMYYSGFLVGTFLIPPLVRRIGHIRAFAFGATCAAMVALAHAIDVAPWLWLTLRLVDGVMMVGLYTIIESWLNAQAPPRHRGVVFALYMMVNSGALAFSQLLIQIPGEAFVLFTVAALLACAATLPVVLTHQAQPSLHTAPRLRLRRLFQLAPTAGAGALLAGLSLGAFYGLAPVYAVRVGFDVATVSYYMAIGILGGAVLQWPLGYWSDRVDRRCAMAVVGGAACVLGIAVWAAGGHARAATVLIFLYCGMSFAFYPMSVAHLVDYLTKDELLGASSSVYLLYGLGSAVGPLIVGEGMARLGPQALPLWFALAGAVLAVYAAYRYRVFRREQVAENNFRPMMQTTRTVLAARTAMEGAAAAPSADRGAADPSVRCNPPAPVPPTA